jgi:outer membrane lipoprotein
MRKIHFLALFLALLSACSPALNRETMKRGLRDIPFDQMRADPGIFKGKLFILGGIIVVTRLTEQGSLIEALSVPVDSQGYLEEDKQGQGRFLALLPRSKGFLDPIVYRKGRQLTLAGEFVETRKGRIDELEYTYPFFEIKELTLWEEPKNYYPPYYYGYPYWDDPWGRPYRDPYRPMFPR